MANTTKPPISEAKRAALAKASAQWKKIAASGTNPRERGEKIAKICMRTVLRWGWSTAALLDLRLGKKRSDIATRLVKRGRLAQVETPNGLPAKNVLILTQPALDEIAALDDANHPYQTDGSRLRLKNCIHDELVQRLTLVRLLRREITDYKTPLMLSQKNVVDIKKPDAVWIKATGEYAIELELTPKWDEKKEFERMIAAVVNDIESEKYQGVLFFFKSEKALERYKNGMSAGAEYKTWKKEQGKTGRYVNTGAKKVSPAVAAKITFHLIEPWMLDIVTPIPKAAKPPQNPTKESPTPITKPMKLNCKSCGNEDFRFFSQTNEYRYRCLGCKAIHNKSNCGCGSTSFERIIRYECECGSSAFQ